MKKLKPSIPKAQTIYTKTQIIYSQSTDYLYHKYKPFVPVVQTICTTNKGLSEQLEGIILTTGRDYLNQRKRLSA